MVVTHVVFGPGKVTVLAFANFSTSMESSSGDKPKNKAGKDTVLDYSKQQLSLSTDFRDKVSSIVTRPDTSTPGLYHLIEDNP